MTTDTGRTYGYDDIYTRGRDYGRKRKTYDRDIDIDTGGRTTGFGGGLDRGFGGGLDRGYGAGWDRGFGGTAFDRGFGADRFGGVWPYDYGTTGYDYGLGRGGYEGFGFPYTSAGRYGLQPAPQAIGEAGYDLGVSGRRRLDESRYRNLRDWNRVEENPNIDELTLWRPRADIFDQGLGGLRVEFELPGVPKEDISLTVRDDMVILTALKPQSRKEEAGFHYQNERHFGKFYRRLALPSSVDPNSVRAYLELGVLKVHLNKAEGAERIAIREGSVPIGEAGASTTGGTTGTAGAPTTGTSAGTTTTSAART